MTEVGPTHILLRMAAKRSVDITTTIDFQKVDNDIPNRHEEAKTLKRLQNGRK